MTKASRIALVAVALLGTGCATVDDFKAMSADERANRVCSRQREVVDVRQQAALQRVEIGSIEQALGRGYRVHRQCKSVPVADQTTTRCTTQNGALVCNQSRQATSFRQECTEQPVAIDGNLERSKLESLNVSVAALDVQARQSFDQCYATVVRMSPEAAFNIR